MEDDRNTKRKSRTLNFFNGIKGRVKSRSRLPEREVRGPETSAGSSQSRDDSIARPDSVTASKSSETKPEPEPTPKRKSLWEAAYNLLDETERDVLSTVQISEDSNSSGASQDSRVLIDTVIDLTKAQYNDYKNGGWKIPISASGKDHINVRKISESIITTALSFKDIITPLTAFDPTQHASAAWSIACLGLTMMSNRYESKYALFESSEYLTDALLRNTSIELHFYQDTDGATPEIENSITRVYKAILLYTVEVQRARNPSNKRKIFDCISAMTSKSFTELRSSIKQEEEYLQQGVNMDQHLQRKQEARSMLDKLDEALLDLRSLLDESILRKLNALENARFDAYQNTSQQGIDDDPLMSDYDGKCKEGTRAEFLQHVMNWAQSPDGKSIFWLNGMAGTGKTTISRTLAASFQEEGILGASFFFKRGEGDRGNAKHLFTTIAKQLAERVPRMIPAIKPAVLEGVPERTIQMQFKRLLEEPLSGLYPPSHQMQPMVIVIDALDECESLRELEEVLRLLPKAAQIQSVPLRFFLTSRPELPKAHDFESARNEFVLHDISDEIIRRDLANFLRDQFRRISDKRNQDTPTNPDPNDWPGQQTIQKLVDLSVPLFIYAATVCRFMRQPEILPDELLEVLLKNSASGSSMGLDQMYLMILEQPMRRISQEMKAVYLREFHGIIGVIVVLATPLSVNALASMTNFKVQNVEKRVTTLRSVLSYSGDRQVPVRPLHLSFRDFLLRTDSTFFVDEKQVHYQLASSCLRIMGFLKRNICGLSSTGAGRADIETKTIGERISSELQYACRFWAHHLANCLNPGAFEGEVLSFLKTHALHWLEAMSLMGILRESISILNTLLSVFQSDTESKLGGLLLDCKRLITRNMEGVEMAPLQIYLSALIFAPQNSEIRKLFQHEIPATISRLPFVDLDWGPLLHTLDDCKPDFVQFSPDGQYLATGTGAKNKINMSDTIAWELQRTLQCPSRVDCVAFSPRSAYLAAGLEDRTVIIWDTVKWKEKSRRTYEDPLRSIAFSREDILAVGSIYNVWASDISFANEHLATSIQTDEWDMKLAFSPSGSLLIVTCLDAVKVWETENWGHARDLHFNARDVCFSPNGDLLSILHNNKVTILETESWTVFGEVDRAHYNGISFSRDGSFLAAAARSNCIEIIGLRDLASRTYLKGHGDSAICVSFSPTADILTSSSHDERVNVWNIPPDILSYVPPRTPHRDYVAQVVISPTGYYAGSRTWKGDFKIWHLRTGQVIFSDQMDRIYITEFSPDSQWFLSWGRGGPLKIWNTATGVMVFEEKAIAGDKSKASFDEEGLLITYNEKEEKRLTQFRSQLRPGHGQEYRAHLRIKGSWIMDTASGKKIMRLPSEYRPEFLEWANLNTVPYAVHDRTVVWGTGSGNVYFMEIGQDSHLQVNA